MKGERMRIITATGKGKGNEGRRRRGEGSIFEDFFKGGRWLLEVGMLEFGFFFFLEGSFWIWV